MRQSSYVSNSTTSAVLLLSCRVHVIHDLLNSSSEGTSLPSWIGGPVLAITVEQSLMVARNCMQLQSKELRDTFSQDLI